MQPVKPQMDMWLKKPALAMESSFKEKHIPLYKDKNCQAAICEYNDSKSQSLRCSDNNCQEIMWPVMPEMDMLLPKPAVLYKYRRLCSDKNCLCTRCYKIKSPVRLMYNYDKNCQSV